MSPARDAVDSFDRTIEALSQREAETGHLWAAGRTAPEISEALGTAVETVRLRISSINAKLGISTRAELRAKFALGVKPPARSPRTVGDLALFLAISDAERESPEAGELVQQQWNTPAYATKRHEYAGRARTLLDYLRVLPTSSVLDD